MSHYGKKETTYEPGQENVYEPGQEETQEIARETNQDITQKPACRTDGEREWETEIEELLRQLTLEEKLSLIHGAGLFRTAGVERLGIPPLTMSDGPMGVRNEFLNDRWLPSGTTDDFVTYLPSNSALAASWSRELAKETGRVLGAEARGRGKDVILAPGINIKRSPLCGRNFEYMSEDPKLVEELVVPLIQGIQENDVAACVKHFAANAQETDRLMVDMVIDERTLREIYLPGFRAAVQKAGTLSLMSAYNKLNGSHCAENRELLGELLRKEWGYDGTIISDWGGVHRTRETAWSPLDIEMSVTDHFEDYFLANPLKRAIEAGEIPESLVDEKVRNILRMMFRLKMLGPEKENRKSGTYNTPEHRAVVYRTAAESIVLLKNEEHRLPLKKKGLKRIALIGANAEMIHSNGGGSAEIKALYELSSLMGMKMRLGGNVEVRYARGYYIPGKEEQKAENWQQDSLDEEKIRRQQQEADRRQKEQAKQQRAEAAACRREALALAEACDEVIFMGGLNHDYDVEGQDRSTMKLPYEQDELIEALLAVRPDTVIVLIGGAPVEMPWRDRAKAILWCYYAGMETGTALADVLLGRVNPSGRLPETFPVSYADTPTGANGEFAKMGKAQFREGIFVGYRYGEAYGKEPAFCFGHGLSYTEFAYEDMKTEVTEACGPDEGLCVQVSCRLTNIGQLEGAETVQLYVGEEAPCVPRPPRELKDFCKEYLAPGETKEVKLTLGREAFGYYDTGKGAFCVNPGRYHIELASSLKDIRLSETVEIAKEYLYR